VIFSNAKLEIAREYEYEVLADPEAEVFKALGTKRQSPGPLVAKSMVGGLKSLSQGMVPRATKADMLRLGADAAVDADGEIVLLHIATSADDRMATEELLAAL
jgi:hypothetical protein